MTNRELFSKDPATTELVNNGVAQVVDPRTAEQLKTLRWELETFVCEGQYAMGLEKILTSYLKNLEKPEQPAAWVSGFYGSGKSHLVKMLRYLWTDFEFPDNKARARGLAKLTPEVQNLLKELATAGRRHGGLHAAAGTLGGGASDSVHLALLSTVFRSAALPEDYAAARFVMWLKKEGILPQVHTFVQNAGKTFEKELSHLYVSPVIAQAVLSVRPQFSTTEAGAHETLRAQFPPATADVTLQQMVEAMEEALVVDGTLPCTLIVLDEVQQYIGDSSGRSYNVQEVTESCSKRFGGRVLFVGTGQSAVQGTPQLQRLQDRFPVAIHLADTDVETVIRKVVLAKKPDKESHLKGVLEQYSGEISRHLQGTKLEARAEDGQYLVADYPLLPVRRRFWERTLRAVDVAGTAGQLRTQLRIVYEAVRATADAPVGTVVAGDYLFDQISTNLLQTGVLLPEIDELIKRFRNGTKDGDLKARLCALIFLIGKLPRDPGADLGVRATAETLADLLVQDLKTGSTELRKHITEHLGGLEKAGQVMRVENEYRLQTRESREWESGYRDRVTKLVSDDKQMASLRTDLLKEQCRMLLKDLKLTQGKSKVARKINLHYAPDAPRDTEQAAPVWVRDGWDEEENTVLADARAAGIDDPTVFVLIPRRQADDLKTAIASARAAKEVLDVKGMPTNPEGQEARTAMETRQSVAQATLSRTLEEIMAEARVFLGGGTERVGGMGLADKVREAAADALMRLYPEFDLADDPRWPKVIERAKKGDKDALQAVDYTGDVDKHPVCATVLGTVAAGKKGKELRKQFANPEYGWPQDAVDAALLVLVLTGHLRALEGGQPIEFKKLDQTKIGVADFRLEAVTLTAAQRIAVRGLFQAVGLSCKPDEEAVAANAFLAEMRKRAEAAGGAPPEPAKPNLAQVEELAGLSGNEQLLALYNARETLKQHAQDWQQRADKLAKRRPRWEVLQRLLKQAEGLAVTAGVKSQRDAILTNCNLLADPDPLPDLCATLTNALRDELTRVRGDYAARFEQFKRHLEKDPFWQRLDATQQATILREHSLTEVPDVKLGTEAEILSSLEAIPLSDWKNRLDALPQRFASALVAAAKLLDPKAVSLSLPKTTLRDSKDAEAWLEQVRKLILEQVAKGPVILS